MEGNATIYLSMESKDAKVVAFLITCQLRISVYYSADKQNDIMLFEKEGGKN